MAAAHARCFLDESLLRPLERGDLSPVFAWLDGGGSVDARDERERTLLMIGAAIGNEELTLSMIRRGADLELQQRQGTTALMFGAFEGHEAIVLRLLRARSNPQTKDSHGLAAEDYAKLHGHQSTMLLLQRYQSLHSKPDRRGNSVLPARMLEAAQTCDLGAVRSFLEEGGDVDAVDTQLGGTMLMCASSAGHLDLIALLLSADANVNQSDDNGCTALSAATFSMQEAAVKALLLAGANVDSADRVGLTALMIASLTGVISLVKSLLLANASLCFQDANGRTALDFALMKGHVGVSCVLRQARRTANRKPPRPAATAVSRQQTSGQRESDATAIAAELLAKEETSHARGQPQVYKSKQRKKKAKRRQEVRQSEAPAAASPGDSTDEAALRMHAVCLEEIPLGRDGGDLHRSHSESDAAEAEDGETSPPVVEETGSGVIQTAAAHGREGAVESARLPTFAGNEIPDSLCCPITSSLMLDPVVMCDGHTYERSAIVEWIESNPTSPITGEPLTSTALLPNVMARSLVREFAQRHPHLPECAAYLCSVSQLLSSI